MITRDDLGGVVTSIIFAVFFIWFAAVHYGELQDITMFGSCGLGALIGWIARFYLVRFVAFNVTNFVALAGALAGGAAVKFLATGPEPLIFFYFSGLVFGFFAAHVWNLFDRSQATTKQVRP